MGDRFLTGINVIDLGSFVAAPAAATVMADYGADVVKDFGFSDEEIADWLREGVVVEP